MYHIYYYIPKNQPFSKAARAHAKPYLGGMGMAAYEAFKKLSRRGIGYSVAANVGRVAGCIGNPLGLGGAQKRLSNSRGGLSKQLALD